MDENPRPDSTAIANCRIYTAQFLDSDIVTNLDERIYVRTTFDDGIVANNGAAADNDIPMQPHAETGPCAAFDNGEVVNLRSFTYRYVVANLRAFTDIYPGFDAGIVANTDPSLDDDTVTDIDVFHQGHAVVNDDAVTDFCVFWNEHMLRCVLTPSFSWIVIAYKGRTQLPFFHHISFSSRSCIVKDLRVIMLTVNYFVNDRLNSIRIRADDAHANCAMCCLPLLLSCSYVAKDEAAATCAANDCGSVGLK